MESNGTSIFRFAAKLLFQFRVEDASGSNTMRTCEERILVLRAADAWGALAEARRRGDAGQHSYANNDGAMVHFEFVGVLNLLHLGVECEEDEVWYDIVRRKLPMERAGDIVPAEDQLNAIREWRSGAGG